jgi:hypothetical protein
VLTALIVIIVLGFCLPVGLWLVARRRMSGPQKTYQGDRYDEIDQWLVSDFGLGWQARSRVRTAVLGRQAAARLEPAPRDDEPAPLEPALLEPARELAARVLADQIGQLRLARRAGWVALGLAAAYAGYGIFTITTGRGGGPPEGVFILLNAAASATLGLVSAVLTPRRVRRNAERVLSGDRSAGAESRPG